MKKLLILQSGGITSVINQSLLGVLEEAYKNNIEVYGVFNGYYGLKEFNIIKLKYTKKLVSLLQLPNAYLGTSREKLSERDYELVFKYFKDHDIHHLIVIGGNGSQSQLFRLYSEGVKRSYRLFVCGIPKTIDNDLPYTDHSPGYPTAALAVINAVRIMELENKSTCSHTPVSILETFGQDSGWLAAASALSVQKGKFDGPHIIVVPEKPFELDRLMAKIKEVYEQHRRVLIVVSEGIKTLDNKFFGEIHTQIQGGIPIKFFGLAAIKLRQEILKTLKLQTRICIPTVLLQCPFEVSSVDKQEAYLLGKTAVKILKKEINSAVMLGIERISNVPYKFGIECVDLKKVVGKKKHLPLNFVTEDFYVSKKFIEYLKPLLRREL